MSKSEHDIKNLVEAQIASLRSDIQSLKTHVEDIPNLALINSMEQMQQMSEASKRETRDLINKELDVMRG